MAEDTSPRWAGFAVVLANLVLVVNITVFAAFFGNVPASDPIGGPTPVERAAHLIQHWGALSTLWVIEVAVYIVLAVGALLLAMKSKGGIALLPRAAAWSAVSIGAILQAAMYAFMLGGYVAAMPVVQNEPGLLDAMYRSALVLFYAGNAAIFVGCGSAFAPEIYPAGIMDRRAAALGAFVCFGAAGLLLAVALAGLPFVMAAPLALLAHVLIAYLGLRLATSIPVNS